MLSQKEQQILDRVAIEIFLRKSNGVGPGNDFNRLAVESYKVAAQFVFGRKTVMIKTKAEIAGVPTRLEDFDFPLDK